MALRLAGKTGLVTGGSRGIGRAIALRLAAEGADVIVHCHRNVAAAREVSSRVVRADLGSVEQIEAMFQSLRDVRLDFLVNNAGVWKPSPVGSTSIERMNEIIDVNLKGPFWTMQCALPLLNDGARVINISSVAAKTGVAGGRSLYGATKAAVESLTRNWAMELAGRGILVNAVAPGYVQTDMTAEHLGNPANFERAMARHPLGRMTMPDDVAGVVAFLCSDDGAFVTGQTINVSGGFVI
ncbi:MAG: SDR family oxidoreductase [Acidobacteria bacterium]|nr:SDR family oxidoreductase [Acidobacteriota bacterium]